MPLPDAIDISDEHSVDADLQRIDTPVRIGRYRLCYELGSGGMASVYLARAEGPGGFAKAVAIKRIHPHLARRRELVEMFLDEARIASGISHPNVCSTFDFGEVDGTYFLAMEYLVGEPLSLVQRRVARRPEMLGSLRWQRCFAKIAADVAEGLHAAHELKDERSVPMNVVHRDVSPQNIFVTYDGMAKVVDFGVAFASDRITRTVTGGIKGKLGYLAPEQLARLPYDRRLDVWALGIVLWEGLTGQRLFLSRSEVDTLLAVQHRVIPPPSSVIPSIPKELDAIVLRALARPMEERFPTARAFSRELVQFLGASGPPMTNVEVGELIDELCGDRRDVRAEVVASVLDDSPRARTATLAPAEHAPIVHDQVTEVRPVGPSTIPAPAFAAPPEPAATAPQPTSGDASATTAIAMRLASLAGLAVLAIAVVAVAAIVVLGSGGDDRPGQAPALPPVIATTPVFLPPARDAAAPVDAAVVPAPALDAARPSPPPPGAPPPSAPPPSAPPPSAPPPVAVREAQRPHREGTEPARPLGHGTVSIISPVSVQVCVRGRPCASTPTRFESLPVGDLTLRFTARDGRAWTQRVRVAPDENTRVVASPP